MKIRSRLTLQYTAISASVFLLSMLLIYLFSEYHRSEEFYRNLRREAVTKAHLFLSDKVDAATMQSIYLNNRNFIDEVEVAVYSPDFRMLYHDASQIDIIKENRAMIDEIVNRKSIEFRSGRYRAVGLLYPWQGKEYVVTAAAYDGYGHANLQALRNILLITFLISLSVLLIAGYFMARRAMKPVSDIVSDMEQIGASRLDERLAVANPNDELGELSMAFNRLLDRLDEAFRNQKMFVSNVSHELRTPMAALMTEFEIVLLKQRTPERYVSALENALADAGRIIKLIDGLLNLARTDYASGQIKMEEIRIDELVLDAREMVLKGNPSYNIEPIFDREAENDSVLTVFGNTYLLTIALVNLMENNCKYSSDHTSVVQISFWEEFAILRFTDHGEGMTVADMAHLFEPFYRGENAGRVRGHGIGMALTKKIVDLHGGVLEVYSHPGDGTSFILKMPHL